MRAPAPETRGSLQVDTRGAVRWYEALAPVGGPTDLVYHWSEDDTWVIVQDGATISEIDTSGGVRWSTGGFDRPLHHGVHLGGEWIYALNAAEHDGRVVDGLYVLDRGGRPTHTWDLADHVALVGEGGGGPYWINVWPDATDWSHGNGVWSDGQTALVSLRWQNAVVALAADPARTGFGEVDWIMTGAPADLHSDFAWTDGGGFVGQHHATPTDDGVMVFDNGPVGADARVVAITLDGATASERRAWSLGQTCTVQGSAWSLADGGVLATCPDAEEVVAFSADGARTWSARATCDGPWDPDDVRLARGIPVHWR